VTSGLVDQGPRTAAPRRGRRARLAARVALIGLVLLPCPACQWLQNEFLALDVAAPETERPPAQTVPW
jgi:hypothetical protein